MLQAILSSQDIGVVLSGLITSETNIDTKIAAILE